MCLGIPGRVVERLEPVGGLDFALVEFGGVRRRVCIACVPEVALDEYVIVHAGIAISRVDAAEAEQIFELLEQLEAAGVSSDLPPGEGDQP
jgi:hydrogenase expression/formation protein HypC